MSSNNIITNVFVSLFYIKTCSISVEWINYLFHSQMWITMTYWYVKHAHKSNLKHKKHFAQIIYLLPNEQTQIKMRLIEWQFQQIQLPFHYWIVPSNKVFLVDGLRYSNKTNNRFMDRKSFDGKFIYIFTFNLFIYVTYFIIYH